MARRTTRAKRTATRTTATAPAKTRPTTEPTKASKTPVPSKNPAPPPEGRPESRLRWLILAVLVLDTVLLATLELFFLPLRMDGKLLPDLGAIPMPLTVIVAVVTTPLLVSTAGRLVHPRAAFVPLVVWVLTVLVLGLSGPGGDLVLVQDWRAFLLLAGGALPAAMALGGALATTATGRKN
jgi:hypothetical protein